MSLLRWLKKSNDPWALRVDRETWKVFYQADDCVVYLSCMEIYHYRSVEVDLAA